MAGTLIRHADGRDRCPWCGTAPDYVAYHDEEWGVPEHDSRALFEKLILDGFQAGLAWITILRKRDGFRARFEGFVPERLAAWGEAEVAAALQDAGIVRHRGKIEATVGNARAYLAIERNEGDFARFLWSFVGGAPVVNRWTALGEAPTSSPQAEALSKALRQKGFRFVGPTIVYAFMQAVGMVDDHLAGCHAKRH
ncbi:DNA-3-methyladenine glycosylase I [Zavarzinia compransoris]|uniref:DNA-3-methyladenine glycosylase I n=1 Tax=Zavarzinia compransoris TaxID=1264899 RepID=A0A317E0Q7_9PROT|nr:DNA-3-methyladenine glycosylase I [Zavarzinia compransoris]PWR18735.1 DNA-3-methyladenine glycosylase I [Zavarzinia compransoris]TDP48718.1 DNA-3-methyladenine glycosylase I [Zavarzinia compransoris]